MHNAQRHVLVFRRDLFKLTEPFIYQQADAHQWLVTYAGQALHGEPPPGSRYLLRSPGADDFRQLGIPVPDIVHAHFGVDIPPSLAIARRLDIPLAVTLHGFDVTRSRLSGIFSGRPNLMRYCLARPRLLRAPDICLAVSTYIARQAIAAGSPKQRTTVHHIGTPLLDLPGRDERTASRRQEFHLVHVARLVEKKGTAVLLHAVARATQAVSPLKLTVVGDGPLRHELIRLAARLGISDHVRFLGARTHTSTLEEIASADALCLPSVTATNGDAEGLGMVMLEAAAIGTPVIASASGGIVDFVQDGLTGLLVDAGDPISLADAICRLAATPVLADTLVANARIRVTRDFDVRVQTLNLERQFERLTRTRPR